MFRTSRRCTLVGTSSSFILQGKTCIDSSWCPSLLAQCIARSIRSLHRRKLHPGVKITSNYICVHIAKNNTIRSIQTMPISKWKALNVSKPHSQASCIKEPLCMKEPPFRPSHSLPTTNLIKSHSGLEPLHKSKTWQPRAVRTTIRKAHPPIAIPTFLNRYVSVKLSIPHRTFPRISETQRPPARLPAPQHHNV